MARYLYDRQPKRPTPKDSDQGTKPKDVREDDVIDFVEKSTTAWRPEGEWITHLHIDTNWKGYLSVKDMKKRGECNEACRTIEYAAREIMGEYDGDVGEALYVDRFGDKTAFERWMCEEKTRACSEEAQVTKPTGGAYAPFVERTEADGSQDVERMLGEMADQGMRGQMFTREEAIEKYMMDMENLVDAREDEDVSQKDEL
jgi:hypothetical protein